MEDSIKAFLQHKSFGRKLTIRGTLTTHQTLTLSGSPCRKYLLTDITVDGKPMEDVENIGLQGLGKYAAADIALAEGWDGSDPTFRALGEDSEP